MKTGVVLVLCRKQHFSTVSINDLHTVCPISPGKATTNVEATSFPLPALQLT